MNRLQVVSQVVVEIQVSEHKPLLSLDNWSGPQTSDVMTRVVTHHGRPVHRESLSTWVRDSGFLPTPGPSRSTVHLAPPYPTPHCTPPGGFGPRPPETSVGVPGDVGWRTVLLPVEELDLGLPTPRKKRKRKEWDQDLGCQRLRL